MYLTSQSQTTASMLEPCTPPPPPPCTPVCKHTCAWRATPNERTTASLYPRGMMHHGECIMQKGVWPALQVDSFPFFSKASNTHSLWLWGPGCTPYQSPQDSALTTQPTQHRQTSTNLIGSGRGIQAVLNHVACCSDNNSTYGHACTTPSI